MKRFFSGQKTPGKTFGLNKIIRQSGSLLLSAALLPFCLISAAYAQYTVTPSRVFIKAKADKPITTASLDVTNTSDGPVRLKTYLKNWYLQQNNGAVMPTDDTLDYGLINKVIVTPKEFTLLPGKTQTVRLGIMIPAELPDGEYRGMLFLEDLKTEKQVQQIDDDTNVGITMKYRAGIGIYYQKGLVSPKPEVSAFELKPVNGKLATKIVFANPGTQHSRVQASMLFSKVDAKTGERVFTKELPLYEHKEILILSNASRVVEETVAPISELSGSEAQVYDVELTVKGLSPNAQLKKDFEIEPIRVHQTLTIDPSLDPSNK